MHLSRIRRVTAQDKTPLSWVADEWRILVTKDPVRSAAAYFWREGPSTHRPSCSPQRRPPRHHLTCSQPARRRKTVDNLHCLYRLINLPELKSVPRLRVLALMVAVLSAHSASQGMTSEQLRQVGHPMAISYCFRDPQEMAGASNALNTAAEVQGANITARMTPRQKVEFEGASAGKCEWRAEVGAWQRTSGVLRKAHGWDSREISEGSELWRRSEEAQRMGRKNKWKRAQ